MCDCTFPVVCSDCVAEKATDEHNLIIDMACQALGIQRKYFWAETLESRGKVVTNFTGSNSNGETILRLNADHYGRVTNFNVKTGMVALAHKLEVAGRVFGEYVCWYKMSEVRLREPQDVIW